MLGHVQVRADRSHGKVYNVSPGPVNGLLRRAAEAAERLVLTT